MKEVVAGDECYLNQLVQLNCNNYPSVGPPISIPGLLMIIFFRNRLLIMIKGEEASNRDVNSQYCVGEAVIKCYLSVFHFVTQTTEPSTAN